ncbi:MAG: hypothetical protein HY718_14135 [Planctomycetes bacterium]|nr:hypothetical protein [Planctomycetota bacterium]
MTAAFRVSMRLTDGPASHGDGVVTWWQWLSHPPRTSRQSARGRVLLISYQFPPAGGSGVQRPAKLAKYLPACGWSVEVLAAGHDRFPWTDVSLLDDLAPHTAVHRIAGYEPACLARRMASVWSSIAGTDARAVEGGEIGRQGCRSIRRIDDGLYWRLTKWTGRLGMGNGESLWIGPATRAAIRRHRESPFHAVISTGPPHFVHRVAMRIAQTTGLPWLADLRDPLVSDFDREAPPARHLAHMLAFERTILQHATMVVTTSPSFACDLRDRYPHRADDIRAILNGFDREDIIEAVDAGQPPAKSQAECTFVAAGAFYGRRELRRIIEPLEAVLSGRRHWWGRVRLVVAGTLDVGQRRYWERNKPDWVDLVGYVDHAAAIRLAAAAACSIVVVPACGHGHLSIPGKTLELLAIPTHILALVPPDSDTARIVIRAGGATVAALENEHAVATAMRQIIESHFAGRLAGQRNWRRVDAFDRRVVAARFADGLTSICGQRAADTGGGAAVRNGAGT